MQALQRLRRLSQRQQDLLALLVILAVALFFRAWQLNRFPPGLFGDEAVNGLDALDVLAGRAQVFYPANFGREGLHMLVLAPFIRWLGPTALALRLPSMLAGVLTALATYWLGRELFARTWLRGTLAPLLAALLLSTSYWHVHFSRFGIRGVFTPLMAALAFAAFWRGANAAAQTVESARRVQRDIRTWCWFLVSGFFVGLGVHFYTASRLIPIFLGLFLLIQAVFVWLILRRSHLIERASSLGSGPAASQQLIERASSPDSGPAASQQLIERASSPDSGPAGTPRGPISHPGLLRRAFAPLAGLYVVAALVFAPLGLYFLRTPGSLTQRASAVSLANPEVSGGNPAARMLQAATANLAQFFLPGAGDQAQFYNLPGRPVFDLLTALLALAGLLLCLRALTRGSSPHLFLLLWFPAMLAPTFLAVDRFPTLPRALGVLPGIYFFPAIALAELAGWARQRAAAQPGLARRYALAAGALIAAVVLWQGLSTLRDYFTRWGPSPETFEAFEGDVAAASDWLAAHPGQEVFLSADIYRHPSFVFLHEHTPLTQLFTYLDPGVHFFDGRTSLPLPPPGQAATYLFTRNAGPDPVLDQAPGWAGFSSVAETPGPDGAALVVAGLANADAASPAGLDGAQFSSAGVPFTSDLKLAGYQVLRPTPTEALVWLLWEVAQPEAGRPESLQVQAGLRVPGAAQQLAQASSELAYRATEWAPGSRVLSWLRLDVPAELPGDLELAVRLINQTTGGSVAPASADGEGWIYLPY